MNASPRTTSSHPSLDNLMDVASREVGLDDFGDADFREGFERFLTSLAQDADLTEAGSDHVVQTLSRRLRNRLEIEAWHAANPEATEASITGPLAITGLPRTGTTALANMLSQDPRFRCLRSWEQRRPLPPPELTDEDEDPRRLEAIRSTERLLDSNPAQAAMHLWDVDATTEDTELLGIAGRPQSAPVPVYGYHEWWRGCDMRGAYRYHRRITSLLQSRRPPDRWLFKSPHLSCHLEDFLDAYPDARFVMTHRDPVRAVPSWVSFVSSLVPPGSDATIDPIRFGRHLADHLAVNANRIVDARERLGPERFLDIDQREIVDDSLGVVERVEEFAGVHLTDDVRASISEWSTRNRSGAHGTHRYTLEQYGLDADEIRGDFASYIERFDVSTGG